MNQGYYLIAQELVYQWLGTWITPYWWTDAHVNKAIAGFLAASTANEVNIHTMNSFKWKININQLDCTLRLTTAKNSMGNGQ